MDGILLVFTDIHIILFYYIGMCCMESEDVRMWHYPVRLEAVDIRG